VEEKTGQRDYLAYCYGNGKIFGEYYVSLIADYFGFPWDCRVAILHRLTIYLRAYTIVDDDVRDIPHFKHESSLEPLRDYFLEMAWMEAHSLSSRGISATKILETELDRYHHTSNFYSKLHSIVKFHAVDVSYTEKYADRMAMIRVPVLLLGSQSKNERLITSGLRGIEQFMRALQIFDDLVDWEEDLREGRITYPVVCYLATLPIAEAEVITQGICRSEFIGIEESIRALSQKLPYHHTVWEQLELACQILEEATVDFLKGLGNRLLSKVQDLRERIDRVTSEYVIPESSCMNQGGLILRLKRSGAAPQRLPWERGKNVGYGRK
jgi:hypothetical protein